MLKIVILSNRDRSYERSTAKFRLNIEVENLVEAMVGFAVPSAGQITLAQTTLSEAQKNQLSAIVSVNWG